jgi:serine/threonine protein kinase
MRREAGRALFRSLARASCPTAELGGRTQQLLSAGTSQEGCAHSRTSCGRRETGRRCRLVLMVSADSRPTPSLSVGTIVADKYRVERVLGSGGMGLVVEARHIELGQAVALKVLHDTALADSDSVQRFFREAQATAALESEHVVRVHDLGRMSSGSPFIVMERLTGRDLADLLEDWGLFSVELAVECVRQAAVGLAEAHAANIVHRDIKPSNLFVTRRRNRQPLVKILDFGISKVGARDQVSLTQTRMVVGSPLYMSPEQVRDARTVDARTDIWSLGAILQELLTGLPPFPGETLPAVCAAIVADEPLPIHRADVTPELSALVQACLEKDPRKRVQTAAELATRLGAFLTRASASIPPLSFDEGSRPSAQLENASMQRIKVMSNQETLVDSDANRLLTDSVRGAPFRSVAAIESKAQSRSAPTQASPEVRDATRRRMAYVGILALVLMGSVALFLLLQREAPKAPPDGASSGEISPPERGAPLQHTEPRLGTNASDTAEPADKAGNGTKAVELEKAGTSPSNGSDTPQAEGAPLSPPENAKDSAPAPSTAEIKRTVAPQRPRPLTSRPSALEAETSSVRPAAPASDIELKR